MPPNADPPPLPPPTPWLDAAAVQHIRDEEHLRLLSIFHYVVGGLAILFSCLFILYIVFGVMILSQPRLFETSPRPSLATLTPAASPDATPAGPGTPLPTPYPAHRRTGNGEAPPAIIGYFMAGIGSAAVLLGWTVGALLIYSGRCLARRTGRVFSMVLAGISCLQVPFGTILGVFTLVVLQRPTIRALYAPRA